MRQSIFKNYITKFILDTVKLKPYKSKWHRNRDLLMFFVGLKKILSGTIQAAANVFAVLFFTCVFVFIQLPLALLWLLINKDVKLFLDLIKDRMSEIGDLVVDSLLANVFSAISGVAMMLVSPIALLRVPFRMLNTNDGYISILSSSGLIKAVAEVTPQDVDCFQQHYGVRSHDPVKQKAVEQRCDKITRVYCKLKKAQEQQRPDSTGFDLSKQDSKERSLVEGKKESDMEQYFRVFREIQDKIQSKTSP